MTFDELRSQLWDASQRISSLLLELDKWKEKRDQEEKDFLS